MNLKITADVVFGTFFLIKTGAIVFTNALDCFSCTNVTNLDDCHDIRTCRPHELCYAETYESGNNPKLYNFGCKEEELCRGIDQSGTISSGVIGKRAVSPPPVNGCVQCCNLHGCNKNLCPTVQITRAPPVIDGGWSNWGSWGPCKASCPITIGLQSRYRTCSEPAPSPNGRNCLGDAKDVQICQISCTSGSTQISTATPSVTTPKQSYITNDLTQAPGECKDLIDCSGYYRPQACHGIYQSWSRRYCPDHCGFCPTVSPPPCVDTISNCNEYQSDICTNQAFWQWVESHCRKFCQLC